MTIWSLAFVKYAGERALKTFCQVLIAFLSATQLGLVEVNWANISSVAALAALVSLLTAVVAATPSVPQPAGAEPAKPELTPEAEAALAKLATPAVTDAQGNKLPA